MFVMQLLNLQTTNCRRQSKINEMKQLIACQSVVLFVKESPIKYQSYPSYVYGRRKKKCFEKSWH